MADFGPSFAVLEKPQLPARRHIPQPCQNPITAPLPSEAELRMPNGGRRHVHQTPLLVASPAPPAPPARIRTLAAVIAGQAAAAGDCRARASIMTSPAAANVPQSREPSSAAVAKASPGWPHGPRPPAFAGARPNATHEQGDRQAAIFALSATGLLLHGQQQHPPQRKVRIGAGDASAQVHVHGSAPHHRGTPAHGSASIMTEKAHQTASHAASRVRHHSARPRSVANKCAPTDLFALGASATPRAAGAPSAHERHNGDILRHALLSGRPTSAQHLRTQGLPSSQQSLHGRPSSAASAGRDFGRVSLFDQEFEYLGPAVRRTLDRVPHGLPPRSPEDFLTRGGGLDLRQRVDAQQHLKHHPINRDPDFQKTSGGINWGSTPVANSMFRRLYDLGTIDFVSVRPGPLHNTLVWGRQVRAGLMSWGNRPSEVEVGKWLPIFLDGIREYGEPYRFLAIRGAEELIQEAGTKLHVFAEDLVAPLKKALDLREPSVVAVVCMLMLQALRTDPQVALVWVGHLWQFAQVLNLFKSKRLSVNMGYNSRDVCCLHDAIPELLLLLEEHGGPEATAHIRRYATGSDPLVL